MRSINSLNGSTPRLTKTMCCSSSKFTTIPMELRNAVRNWAWGKSFLATSCRKSNQKRYLKCAPDSQQVRIREQEEESLSWLSYGRRHWPFSEIWKEKRLEEWQRNIFTNHLKSYSTIKYCLHCWCLKSCKARKALNSGSLGGICLKPSKSKIKKSRRARWG